MTHHADLFTNRQLNALTAFAELVGEAEEKVVLDAHGDSEYARAVATYLALCVSRMAGFNSSLAWWHPDGFVAQTFARPTLSMIWDYAEVAVLGAATGSWSEGLQWVCRPLALLPAAGKATVAQRSAQDGVQSGQVVATDPPYYDNIGYGHLSDFYYVWLRRMLSPIYPDLFRTIEVPKTDELIAEPGRFGGSAARAEEFFESGLRRWFRSVARHHPPEIPLTLFYAFKQSDLDAQGRASTGWEKMLEGLVGEGFAVVGTWPMRTERGGGVREHGRNALASSIVLVCRPRSSTAGLTDRRGFLNELTESLRKSLRDLKSGGIAPVDLAQAAIGPGMAVFSGYAKVVEPDGTAMRVRTALTLINQVLDEVTAEQEGEFDEDTRWAVAWYTEYGMDEGPYGRADDLSRAKNVSVDGLVRAGIVRSGAGKVRLLERNELDAAWDPTTDERLTVWEVTQHLIRRLLTDGEASAGELLGQVGGLGDAARDLAYRLFQIAEGKKWSKEAGPYNALAASWLELSRIAALGDSAPGRLF